MKRYTTAELEALPVLCQGQADDLRIEWGGVRYWLSRTGVADGEPYDNTVTIETYNATTGRWTTWDIYDGDDTTSRGSQIERRVSS